jgi:hypothetical protein
VAFAGGGPLLEHVGALFGELREPPLHRVQVILRVAPVLKRDVEASDLRLELGEAVFQPLSLQFHGFPRVAPDDSTKTAPRTGANCLLYSPIERGTMGDQSRRTE